MSIPSDKNKVIAIFYTPSLRLLSLTLEQNMATNTTGMILQDLTIITTGKLVILIATILDKAEIVTKIAQGSIFLLGIKEASDVKFLLIRYPKIHAIADCIQIRDMGLSNDTGSSIF